MINIKYITYTYTSYSVLIIFVYSITTSALIALNVKTILRYSVKIIKMFKNIQIRRKLQHVSVLRKPPAESIQYYFTKKKQQIQLKKKKKKPTIQSYCQLYSNLCFVRLLVSY